MALASQAALLDELMGRNRNSIDEFKKETHWDDADVCSYFLAGLCPHGLFTNTKADLGPCEKLHDENLVGKYRKSSRYGRMGFEEQLKRLLDQLIADVERRIWKGQERLRLNGPSLNGGFHEERKRKLAEVTEKINDLIEKAEKLGSEGNVMESQRVLAQTEDLKYEQNFYQKEIEMLTQQSKELEVCDICGAFRIKDDAPQRVEEHLAGKMHIGYTTVRDFIKSIPKESSERQRRRRRADSDRGGRSRDKDRVRSRSRGKRRSGDRHSRKRRCRSKDTHRSHRH